MWNTFSMSLLLRWERHWSYLSCTCFHWEGVSHCLKTMWNTSVPTFPDPVGIQNCEPLFSPLLAYTTKKKATNTAEMMCVLCVAFFLVVNASRHMLLRACKIPRSVSKTVINFFHYGLHLRPKQSNTYSGDDVFIMCCYFLGCKCKQWWKKLFTVLNTYWVRGRWGGRCFTSS